ncbi:hypothetical protein C8Q76DRAFT_800781 [Earliella scabrosa]|nr:hypothetical protein C8Q76DRAFT_800781 [Earliella scabrosa]
MASEPSSLLLSSLLQDSRCPGCRKPFGLSAFWKHLNQTKKPGCVAIFNQVNLSILSSDPVSLASSSTLAHDLPPPDVDMDVDPIPFPGDFFGEYNPEDVEDGGPEDSGSDDGSEDDEDEVTLNETSWEPPPAPLPLPLSGPSSSTAQAADNATAEAVRRAEREAQHATARRTRKTFVVPYPNGAAGAPLP